MGFNVKVPREVIKQLNKIEDYYLVTDSNKVSLVNFHNELKGILKNIEIFPFMYPVYYEEKSHIQTIRYATFLKYNYRLFYIVEGNDIVIVGIYNDHQNFYIHYS